MNNIHVSVRWTFNFSKKNENMCFIKNDPFIFLFILYNVHISIYLRVIHFYTLKKGGKNI